MNDPNLPPIFVADDDPSSVALVRAYLQRLALKNPVETARDGDEALEILTRLRDDARPPALCLLDLHMPYRSGLDVLKWLHGEPALASVPVVLLTGSAQGPEVEEAFAAGVTSYLVKPVGFSALGDVLRELSAPWAFLTK